MSVLINAKHEPSNIQRPIRSVLEIADESIVADMASTDNPARLASPLNASTLNVEDIGFAQPAEAVAMASGTWIFLLDADEVLPPALGNRLRIIADEAPAQVSGVTGPFITFMCGKVVDCAGWSRSREKHLRFFRRDAVSVPTHRTHQEAIPCPRFTFLELPPEGIFCVRHYAYLDWSHFLSTPNRYTTLEARHGLDTGDRVSLWKAMAHRAGKFLDRYLRDGGFKHGVKVGTLSALMSLYWILVKLKMRDLKNRPLDAAWLDSFCDRDAQATLPAGAPS